MKKFSAIAALALCVATSAAAQTNFYPEIAATDAKNHIGEMATVYGSVYRIWSFRTGRYVMTVCFDIDGYDTNRAFGIAYPQADNEIFFQLKKFQGLTIAVSGKIGTNRLGFVGMTVKSVDKISMWGQPNQDVNSIAVSGANSNQVLSKANQNPSSFSAMRESLGLNQTIGSYQHAKVTSVEPDGLNIMYEMDNGGIGGKKIPFEELPLDIQQQYGYDPQNASAYIDQKKKAANQAEADKRKKQEQDRQEELAAEAAAAQILSECAQQAYAQAKEDYDRQIQLSSLQAQQKAALAQTMQAREAAQQTAIMKYNAILQQQQLYQQQQQIYQQQRTADGINNINQQIIFNRVFGQ
jgi:hypothetical protein